MQLSLRQLVNHCVWPKLAFKLQVWLHSHQEFTANYTQTFMVNADCITLLLVHAPRGVFDTCINTGAISRPLSFSLFLVMSPSTLFVFPNAIGAVKGAGSFTLYP